MASIGGMQMALRTNYVPEHRVTASWTSHGPGSVTRLGPYDSEHSLSKLTSGKAQGGMRACHLVRRRLTIRATSATPAATPSQDGSKWHSNLHKLRGTSAPPLSDMVWAAAGCFAAMAGFGWMDTVLAPHGLSMTLGTFAASCCLLFALPQSPVSQRWNVVVAHMGCALIGVLALLAFGPGWVARGAAVGASVAYMQFTGSLHPPACGLPLIFIDVAKFQRLQWWYILFPGLAGCVYIMVLQEIVLYLRNNVKF